MGLGLVAGCSSGTTGSDPGGPADHTAETATDRADDDGPPSGDSGTFRLLISDQPVAIGEFDELNVSFDRARIFRGEGTGEDETGATDTETTTTAEPATATETETEIEGETPEDDGQRGFHVIDLEGATVDLTQVVGDKAIGVFEGELPEGRYTKIELYAAGVEGIVDGESVGVKIPSGKLQIVKPFEVDAGETLSFVFDINVVKKGRTGEYNLLPVISGSGVAGRDVEVEEVEEGETGGRETPDGGTGVAGDGQGSGRGRGSPGRGS